MGLGTSKARIFWIGVKIAPLVLVAEITWLLKYSRHPEKAPIEYRYKKAHKLICRIIKRMNLDIKANHVEYLNGLNTSFLAISNHRFFLDPIFYIYFSEKPISFVAKKEVLKIPFVSQVLKAIDGLTIDREDIIHQVDLFRKIAARLKKNDLSYLIFAEGTRMKNKNQIETLPYKPGSLKPAYWAEKNILYVATYGTHLILDKKLDGFKKRNLTFEFHKPLLYEEFKDKPTTQLMPFIEKETNKTLIRIAKENNERNLK